MQTAQRYIYLSYLGLIKALIQQGALSTSRYFIVIDRTSQELKTCEYWGLCWDSTAYVSMAPG